MDRTEFDKWAWQVGPALHRTGFLLTGDWTQSRDLVVEACSAVYAEWGRIGAPETHARALIARKAAAGRPRVQPATAGQAHTGLSTMLGQENPAVQDRRAAMTAALDALAPRDRTVLVLQYYDGLTEEQVARDLGWDVETVHVATDRALNALRARGLDDGWHP